MVAYSFCPRFVAPIISGRKSQTIRADRARHAKVGEELQLYTGMRTKHCRLIGRATCAAVNPIRINFGVDQVAKIVIGTRPVIWMRDALDAFSRSDGFKSFDDMKEFWKIEHGNQDLAGVVRHPLAWDGILIEWKDLRPGEDK